MKKKIIYLSLILIIVVAVVYLSMGKYSNSPIDAQENHTNIKFEFITVKKLIETNPSLATINKNYPKITPELLKYSYGLSLNNDSILSVGLRKFGEQEYVIKIEEELSKRTKKLEVHQLRIHRGFNRLKYTF